MSRGIGLLLALLISACSMFPTDTPSGTVRLALDRVAARDLVGASNLVCAARRNARDFPFPIPGIFQQVGTLPGYDIPRTLAVMTLDVSRVTAADSAAGADTAEVGVHGKIVLSFDAPGVEALFRAMAAESGQPLDEELLATTMSNVSSGAVELDLDEVVPVVREAGAWRVCPAAPVR